MKQKLRVFLTLLLCAVASVGWGQEVTYSMTPNQDNTGSTATTYITSLTGFTYEGVSWKMNQWNPSTLQVRTNQSSAASEFRFYNTSAFSGRITQVVITFSALTVSDASKLMFLGGTSEVTATTGGTAGTWDSTKKTLTWTPGASDNFTYFAFYQNGKAASGSNYLAESDAIVVTYESSSSSAVATTMTIDASGITNTDVFTSTAAGLLTATVMAGEETISDATVTWSSSNESVATIEASTGEVTLVAAGIVTFKASYAGVTDTYKPSFATYEMTVTSSAPVIDYAELPFIWEGGASAALIAQNGVTANGLGSDYASSNAPYLVKFDNTGDFIQVKTNGQPGKVSIDVKMFGGANTSSITVQGSSDGETFTNVQVLTISGSQNDELELESVKPFTADVRYVRLYFTKGSNIGVGAISIAMPSSDPVISAENVNIEYNTTSGSVEYEIVNPVEGGVISATSDAEWLTFGETGVAFTATVNEAIDARTANVTLTYTYNNSAENVTKEITITQAGNPNAPGTQNNPFTVEQAIANTPASGTSANVYIQGIVSAFFADDIVSDGTNYRYYISDNGSTDNQLLVYRGKGLNNVVFSDANDLAIGDEVVIYGGLTTYSEAPEVASGNYIISLNRPEKPKHVVTFSVNGEETTAEVQEGEAIVFPDAPADIYCKTFMGWTDEEINGEQDEAPEMVTSATMGTEDVIFFAVFAKKTPGEVTEITDVLTRATTGITGTTYTSWSGKTLTSSAVYAGNSAGGNSSIQLRSTNNSGIITTKSGGKLKKIVVDWNSNTSTDRSLWIYGKNSAYSSVNDIYNTNNQGKEIGKYANGTTEINVTDDFEYLAIRSYSGALYLNSISIIWEGESAPTYFGYCTTVPVPEPVTVSISAAGYSTLYYGDRHLVVPANMEAYTVKVTTQVERSTTYNAGDVIPAGTGVVLKAAKGSYTFNVSATAGDKDNDNMLRGSDVKALTTGGKYYYALTLNAAKDPDSAGFYWMVDGGGAYEAGAHKAYLALDKTFAELAGNGTAKGYLALPGDETDGIGQIEFGQTGNAGIYNLNGQKVNKAQKGIYIVNGKKVVIR